MGLKSRHFILAASLLAVSLTSCTQNPFLGGAENGQEAVDTPAASTPDASSDASTSEQGIVDPHSYTSAQEFNIFLWSEAEEQRREFAWLWSEDEEIAAVNIQTASGRMMLRDETNNRYYPCTALTLNCDIFYLAYSDFNCNEPVEGGFSFTESFPFNRAIFHAYVAPDGDSSHRSPEIWWDSSKVAADPEHPELGTSIFINEDVAMAYSGEADNPGVFYNLDDFLASAATSQVPAVNVSDNAEISDLNIYLTGRDDLNYLWGWNAGGSYGFQAYPTKQTVEGIEGTEFMAFHLNFGTKYNCYNSWDLKNSDTFVVYNEDFFDGFLMRNQAGNSQTGDITPDYTQMVADDQGNFNLFVDVSGATPAIYYSVDAFNAR